MGNWKEAVSNVRFFLLGSPDKVGSHMRVVETDDHTRSLTQQEFVKHISEIYCMYHLRTMGSGPSLGKFSTLHCLSLKMETSPGSP